jgi:hypothetical protein
LTLYTYTLDLTDMEMVPLRAAITRYIAACRSEIAAGNTTPYQVHLERLEKLMADLEASSTLLSRYVPATDGKPARIELGDKLFEGPDDAD